MKELLSRMTKPPVERGPIEPGRRPLTAIIATFFFIGYIRAAPGTWASLATTLLAYLFLPAAISTQILVTVAFSIIAVVASARAEEIYGHDSGPIVIDEVAGMLVTLIGVPQNAVSYALAFVMFRLFDIIKPFPVHLSEKLPGGWGVTADDLIAGLYALVSTRLIIMALALIQG